MDDLNPEEAVTPAEPRHLQREQSSITGAPLSGRQAFRGLRRQITDEEAGSPGVTRLILDEMERLETENAMLTGYIERFHEADKRASIAEERMKTSTAIEIFFGVGVGIGSSIVGLAPFFWQIRPSYGVITLLTGAFLVIGVTVGRLVKK